MANSTRLWLINATHDFSALGDLFRQAQEAKQVVHVLHTRAQLSSIVQAKGSSNEFIRLIELAEEHAEIPLPLGGEEAEIVFLPCAGDVDWADLQQRSLFDHLDSFQLIVPVPAIYEPVNCQTEPLRWFGWRAPVEMARRILREPSAWKANGLELVEALQHWDDPPRWHSISIPKTDHATPLSEKAVMNRASRVLVVISFFKCEEWLHACLASMTNQTRPPENIVVVDDCSPALPARIVERFPKVTLLSTTQNIGPERIFSNIIRATDYDAYMVQDPDDWASCDRLELSLRYAEQTGADLVGTQEVTIHQADATINLSTYALDVNRAMANGAIHNILHCTGLFSRSLVRKLGGFDENLKLAADTDFIVRAWHAGRIVNLPHFCVFHRVRAGSLTTHADTCHTSPARSLESKFILIRNRRNLESIRAGRSPNLVVQQKTPVDFVHRLGPKLNQICERDEEIPFATISDA